MLIHIILFFNIISYASYNFQRSCIKYIYTYTCVQVPCSCSLSTYHMDLLFTNVLGV